MLYIISALSLIPAGIIISLLPVRIRKFKYYAGILILLYIAVISLITIANSNYSSFEVGEGVFKNTFAITPFAVIILLVTTVAGMVILFGSQDCYPDERDIAGAAIITYGFMAGLLFSQNGLYFAVFLLLMSLGMWRLSDRDNIEANIASADHSLLVRLVGWLFMVIGLVYLYLSGDDFSAVTFRLSNDAFPTFLILLGLLAHGGLFPFQFWLGDDTYYQAGAGALINTVFSSFPILYGLVMLMGSYNISYGGKMAIAVFTILTILICAGVSLIISNRERILGNSSASFNSIAFMLVLFGGNLGIELALWLLTVHAGSKILLFFIMMASDHLGIKRDMRQAKGVLGNFPLLSISAVSGVLFLAPLIPLVGFTVLSPIIVIFSAKFWLLGLLLSISLFLTVAYLIRLMRGYLWGSKHEEQAEGDYPRTLKLAIYSQIFLLVFLTLIIFLTPRIINWLL